MPAELLKAGGGATAVQYSKLYGRVVENEQWPKVWAGGRIVDIYKRKGSPVICDSSRGILLSSHASKGLANILADEVEPCYNRHLPECQHGAVAGKGTDLAAHMIRSLLDLANLARLSIFILFIDLVKAFDRVIREIVFGFPDGVDEPLEYLLTLGLTEDQAHWYAQFIAVHSPLFLQWGVKPKMVKLLRNLHASSWSSYGDLDTEVIVRVGGRQGCKFGATVFNSPYAVALIALRDSLLDEGVVLRLHAASEGDSLGTGAAFNTDTMCDSKENDVPVLGAAFVDDEAIAILAKPPAQLDKSVKLVLKHVVRICTQMRLEINWSPGKTEGLLRYRGHGGAKRLEQKRRSDGSLGFPIPGSFSFVNIVEKYKHLGGVVCCDGNLQPEAIGRCRSATATYVPIGAKVFGSSAVNRELKCTFLWSLVLSRLLFNSHILVPTLRYVKTVNFVYMRVLRRIGDCSSEQRESDLAVRWRLKMPSIECILIRMRLRYLQRIFARKPKTLIAILSLRVNGAPIPWVGLVRADLRAVWSSVALCSRMPDPAQTFEPWERILRSKDKWKQILSSFTHVESSFGPDRCGGSSAEADLSLQVKALSHASHLCSFCSDTFLSYKSMVLHQRTKHGARVEQRYFSNKHGDCQVCLTTFHTHARLLRHLTDRRGSRCWARMSNNPGQYKRLTDAEVEELDTWYREEKTRASRSGHSHIQSAKPALLFDGSITGHVRR